MHIESMDFSKFVDRIRSKDLILDLRLKKSPEIALGHAVSTQFGEISWQGLGGTPFRPALMTEQPTPGKLARPVLFVQTPNRFANVAIVRERLCGQLATVSRLQT